MDIAHTKNRQGRRQELLDHLGNVAVGAATFSEQFGAEQLGRLVGLLHDVGKFDPAFQQYLLDAEATPTVHTRGPDHKGAGAILARTLGAHDLAFLVAGHHGGLPARKQLQEWLRDREADPAVQEAIRRAQEAISAELGAVGASVTWPAHIQSVLDEEFLLRMLFSTLVDADYLDTERHFQAGKAGARSSFPTLAQLVPLFDSAQEALTGTSHDLVNAIRDEVYRACLAAAPLPPGFFRLTVPTGGGKTRSSLAFALRHAQEHQLRRIIYAIPYTSITEQTADVFRSIFGPDALLEHHSAIAAGDQDRPTELEVQRQLAAENWDASLIVTTTVQLFESLMAHRTSACRKLHNIAGSVVILDEAQTLPTNLLAPILDVLTQLVKHYQVSVIICTATQPALDTVAPAGFADLRNIREIVPDPERLFRALERVEYSWSPAGDAWSWGRVADVMRQEQQVLAIVNTRKDAVALLDALAAILPADEAPLHLSTWMCGAHRRRVLADVRNRLQRGVPCRLVSTQVIEAGVDVDFPLVLRAMGPLDSIVQAAGRCNRNGRLSGLGKVIVFEPETGALPPGPYRIGTSEARRMMQAADFDFHDPAVYRRYFHLYYDKVDPDEHRIQALRQLLDYPEVDMRFRMIGEDTVPAVVDWPKSQLPYTGQDTDKEGGGKQQQPQPGVARAILAQLIGDPGHRREHLRALQPYLVSLRRPQMLLAVQQGLAEEIGDLPGLYVWKGGYDDVRGIDPFGSVGD